MISSGFQGAGSLTGVFFYASGTPRIAAALTVCAAVATAVSAQPFKTAYDDDGVVTVNAERRFILGSYAYESPGPDIPVDEAIQELAETGFNLVYIRGGKAMEAAEAAARHGLMTWMGVGAPQDEEAEARVRRNVARASQLPGLGMVETYDEPAYSVRIPDRRMPPEAIHRAYAIIREVIPDRLVYLNHAPANLVSTLQRYNAGTDIVAVDIYPVNPGVTGIHYVVHPDGLQGDLNNIFISQVGEYIQKMRRVAGPNRPLFSVQQAFAWEDLKMPAERDPEMVVYPTYAELRFMAYQAIIESATGILYWGHHTMPKPSEHWSAVKRVVRELADFEDVLTGRTVDIDPGIAYHELGHSVDDGVRVLIKDVGPARYLLTCNADRYPCRATLSGLGDWKRATAVHEERDIAFAPGTLTDTWDAFGVHIYRLER